MPMQQDKKLKNRHVWLLVTAVAITSSYAMIFLGSADQDHPDCQRHPVLAGENAQSTPCLLAHHQGDNRVLLRWQPRDSDSKVYIYDDLPPDHDDPGIQSSDCQPALEGYCSIEVTVTEGGRYQWTLAMEAGDGTATLARTALDIPAPPPLELVSGGGFVDLLRPTDQQFSWRPAADATPAPYDVSASWVELKSGSDFGWPDKKYARQGSNASYQVSSETLSYRGEHVFLIRDCHLPEKSTNKFCSPPISVGYKAGYDHFKGQRNRHVPAGEALEISFTNRSGDVRLLSSSLLPGADPAKTSGHTITIPGEKVTPGVHEISLDSCLLPEGPCSNRKNAARPEFPGLLWQKEAGSYQTGEAIGRLFPLDGSPERPLLAPATGRVFFTHQGPVHLFEADALLAYSITPSADILRIVAGAAIEWETDRDYTLDFRSGIALSSKGSGQALDIVFDNAGRIWMLNEFSNSLEHVSREGKVHSFPLPVARHLPDVDELDSGAFPATRPFSISSGDGNLAARTVISPLAEKLLHHDGMIWFTQGGGLQKNTPSVPNHSRVVSFEIKGEDLPETPFDDRFCIYNLPSEDTGGIGNAQIIGIASSRGRIWVAESHGILNSDSSQLSSFVPNRKLCRNLLNYDQPQALTEEPLRYCVEGRSSEQDGCMERIPLPEAGRPLKIAHLQADPDSGVIWFTDASGQYLGSYDMDGEAGFELIPIIDTHLGDHDTIGELGGFPWDLKVTDDAVYIGEYAARHILRYDKAQKRFSEVHVPYSGQMVRLHSLSVDGMRERLWFTLANECAIPGTHSRSTIGYIDLASWRQQVTSTNSTQEITGVTYSGLGNIPGCEMHPGKHQSFRGIAIDPNDGTIAIATMLREQMTLLHPLPGFWP